MASHSLSNRATHLTLTMCVIGTLALPSPCRAQQTSPTPTRLDLLRVEAPALEGYYGDPGLFPSTRMMAMEWHPSGRVVGYQPLVENGFSDDMLHHLGLWLPDAKLPRLVHRGLLDAGWPFAFSSTGEWFCAMTSRVVDDPTLPSLQAGRTGAFNCFRWVDRTRVWMLPYDQGEDVVDVCFVNRDAQVALLVNRSGQSILKLINAADGKELRRLLLPGVTGSFGWPLKRRMILWGQSLAILRSISGPERLMRVRLDTWAAEPVSTPMIENDSGSGLSASADGRWLGVTSGQSYAVIQEERGKFTEVVSGSNLDPLIGSEITALAFSPNGKLAFVAATTSAKLIDLATRRDLQTIKARCHAATFSPDGSALALATPDQGFRLWKVTRDGLEEPNSRAPQNQGPVQTLRFLNDGSALLAGDDRGFVLWDTKSRRPRARLAGNPTLTQEYAFTSAAVVDNGKSLIAGDGYSFLRWALPPGGGPANAVLPEIKPERAFSGALTREEPIMMNVGASNDGQCVLLLEDRRLSLRNLRQPDVLRPVTLPPIMTFDRVLVGDLPDRGSLVLHAPGGGGGWFEVPYNGGAASALPMASGRGGIATLFLPKRKASLQIAGGQPCLVELLTGQILAPVNMPEIAGRKISVGLPISASPDERYGAGFFDDVDRSQKYLSLWDLSDMRLVALQPLPSNTGKSLAFSPDGQRLACGHASNVISEWSVARLIATAPPEPVLARMSGPVTSPLVAVRPPAPRSVPVAQSPAADPTTLPVQPIKDDTGKEWQLLPGGMISAGERLPTAGRLLVDDTEFKGAGVRVFYSRWKDHSSQIAGCEGPALNQQLWVARHLCRPPVLLTSEVLFADTFTNVSAEPLTATVAVEVQFPADTKALLDSKFRALTIPADGTVMVDPGVDWLAPSQSGKPGESLPLFYFTSESASQPTDLRWDAQKQVLRASYQINLAPWERCHLMHGLCMQKRDPQATLDVFIPEARQDLGSVLLPTVSRYGLNFGRVKNPHTDPKTGQMVEWAYEPSTKDAAGFKWNLVPGMSLEGELGASSILALNLDGKPMSFAGKALFPPIRSVETSELITQGEMKGMMRAFRHPDLKLEMLDAHSPDHKFSITRHTPNTQATASTLWTDYIRNNTDETTEVHVAYSNVFQSPPVAILDAKGQPMDLSRKEFTASELGGVCAIVMPGGQRPATILKFFQTGAQVEPQLRWVTEKVMLIEYTFPIEAKTKRTLRHQAGQRLLGAFPDLADALAEFTTKLTTPDKNPSFVPINME